MPIYELSEVQGLTEERRDAWIAASTNHRASWSCWTTPQGFVVVAADEAQARRLAGLSDERCEPWWLDPAVTVCNLVIDDGRPRVVMINMPTG